MSTRLLRTLLAFILLGSPSAKAREVVDAILILAVDASGSVSDTWKEVQKRGYADAFRSQQVANAIRVGAYGRIAVTFVEWSSYDKQLQHGGWVVLTPETAVEYAAIPRFTLPEGGSTSIQGALAFCTHLIDAAPFITRRVIIDISGDGVNNQRFDQSGGGDSTEDLGPVRDNLIARNVTINGLPLGGSAPELDEQVARYYAQKVIGGPGAFSIFVPKPLDSDLFTQALVLKLVRDIVASNDAR